MLIVIEYDESIGIRDFLVTFNIGFKDFMKSTYPTVPIYHSKFYRQRNKIIILVARPNISSETHRPMLSIYYYQKLVFSVRLFLLNL